MAIGIPYDVGQTNRVYQASQYLLPQDEPPAPLIDRRNFVVSPDAMMLPARRRFIASPDAMLLPPPRNIRQEFQPTPTPPVEEIGPGIPLRPPEGGQVASFDLPTEGGGISNIISGLLRSGGGGTSTATASASPSRRYSSTRPEFIFTNPAAAQQAAANYAARLGYESAQDQGYRDYLARREATQQAQVNQAENTRQLEADRALRSRLGDEGFRVQREGFSANERITGAAESARQKQNQRAEWSRRKEAFIQGSQLAETQNRNPNAKVPAGLTYQGADGRWRAAIADPGPDPSDQASQTVESVGIPSENIADIVGRVRPTGSMVSVQPIPSPGHRLPARTDFAVPAEYPGGPLR